MSDLRKRLATILALDVAGYSRASERDDAAAAEAVAELRVRIERIIEPFGGRVFSIAGDGFMMEFPSADAGVRAAIALLAAGKSGERPLNVHIGLHLGDVIPQENGDLLGHGVNVAARLQALADPGMAMISEAVRGQVRESTGTVLVPRGRVQLDKMNERIEVFSLGAGRAPAFGKLTRRRAVRAAGATLIAAGGLFALSRFWPGSRGGADTSLAVLPFTSLTNQGDDAAFAAGLHDDLLNRLAQIASLRVIARTSVMGYAGTTKRINRIAAELNVAAVLEGSVQRLGARVRVAVQLIDGENELQKWAETYDRQLTADSLFDIQRDIAEAIARALGAALTTPERAAIGAGGTRDL